MTTGESLTPRGVQNLTELERLLSSSVQKVDGCLAVLMICAVDEAEKQSFDALVGELRTFKTWLQQGLTAARMMGTKAR